MKLYFRLLWSLFLALWQTRRGQRLIEFPDGESALWFRVWPTDCDINFHMTHSRYGALSDIGRLDYAIRAGLGKTVRQEKWAAMMASYQVEFRREIKPFERFVMRTRFLGWEGTNALTEQTFYVLRGGEELIAARAFVRAGFYNRKKGEFVAIDEIANKLGYAADSPTLGETENTFIKARLTPSKNRPRP